MFSLAFGGEGRKLSCAQPLLSESWHELLTFRTSAASLMVIQSRDMQGSLKPGAAPWQSIVEFRCGRMATSSSYKPRLIFSLEGQKAAHR